MSPWKPLIAALCLSAALVTWTSADGTAPAPSAAPQNTANPSPKSAKKTAKPKKKTEKFKPTRPYVEGEVLVQFKDGPESPSAVEANRKVGGTVIKVLAKLRLALVQLPPNSDTIKAIETYRRQPGVVTAEPNYVVSPMKRPANKPAQKSQVAKPAPKNPTGTPASAVPAGTPPKK